MRIWEPTRVHVTRHIPPAPSAPLNRWHRPGIRSTWSVLPRSLVLPAFFPTFSCRFLQKAVVLLLKQNPMEHKKPPHLGDTSIPITAHSIAGLSQPHHKVPVTKLQERAASNTCFTSHSSWFQSRAVGHRTWTWTLPFSGHQILFLTGQTALYGEMCKNRIRAVFIPILPASRNTSAVGKKNWLFSLGKLSVDWPKLIACTNQTSLAGWWMPHHDTLLPLSSKDT